MSEARPPAIASRLIFRIVAVAGTLWACGLAALAAIAFADAYDRCPGNQCSDALLSGGCFLALAAAGVLLALISVIRLRSLAHSSGTGRENGLS